MSDEETTGTADDLFQDPPSATPARATKCSRCGREYTDVEDQRFCGSCGAPLHADGTVGTVRVLLAEDAMISRRKIGAILNRLGCEVAEAVNGREAVGLAHRFDPHLIILDVHMPEMDGLEVLDKLRTDEKFANTTIVMLTGEADASVVRDAVSRGARDYIRKDSTPTELHERINKHIQHTRTLRPEPPPASDSA